MEDTIHNSFLGLCGAVDKQPKFAEKNDNVDMKKKMSDFAALVQTTLDKLDVNERTKTMEEFLDLFFAEMTLRTQTHHIRLFVRILMLVFFIAGKQDVDCILKRFDQEFLIGLCEIFLTLFEFFFFFDQKNNHQKKQLDCIMFSQQMEKIIKFF